MELDLTTANAAAGLKAEPVEEVFGIRPDTGRPHSISLQPAAREPTSRSGAAGLDLLIGVGIGAAIMYYLDPDAGPARRARARGALLDAVAVAPEVFEDAAREVSVSAPFAPESSPAGKLLAGAIGAALTFLGGRRRDALGAAVGVLGSALLARGMSTARSAGSEDGARRTYPPA